MRMIETAISRETDQSYHRWRQHSQPPFGMGLNAVSFTPGQRGLTTTAAELKSPSIRTLATQGLCELPGL